PLHEAGAEVTTSPEKAIQGANCLILMLTNAAAIQDTILSEETRSHLTNHTIIQMATIAPSESREIRDAVVKAGGEYLEAPVLGSIPQVKSGTLQVMVGASESQFQQWLNLLKNFGEPMLIGEVGTASALKLALNQLIASLTNAFALSLGLVQREGVNVETFMSVLRESALYAPTFDKKLERMCDRNFSNPNFPTKHLLKDIDLFLNQAQSLNLNTQNLEGVRQVVQKAMDLGLCDEDYSALYTAVNPQE
ncbi:MAG: NAD(P)-dependent oxidoreductase, partial [Cyanobacteriota bacterium]